MPRQTTLVQSVERRETCINDHIQMFRRKDTAQANKNCVPLYSMQSLPVRPQEQYLLERLSYQKTVLEIN